MNDRWAEETERRARARWTDTEIERLTEGKALPILPTTAPVLLRALGLLQRDASMPPPQVRKFLQLNHMLRLLGPPLRELMDRFRHLHIVDAGCGLSYLTLALAWCFEHVYQHPVTIVGIDRDEARIGSCRAATERVGLSTLTFRGAAIAGSELPRPLHCVLSLHACDTATDEAIVLGLRHRAELIAVAPCCQAELAAKWADRPAPLGNAFAPLWSTPHLRREAAATVTDTMRTLLLQAAGYETRVVEFVPSKHTPKNTLIRAMRRGAPDEDGRRQYLALRDAVGGTGIGLEREIELLLSEDSC